MMLLQKSPSVVEYSARRFFMNKGLMTEGNVYEKIVRFAVPLLIGNFFQLMYNTIDSIVVGNYVGKTALAAVGASTPIINLMIAFFAGLGTGASVVVSRAYGARRVDEETKAIHSFMLFAVLFGLFLSLVGIVLSGSILHWISTPADVFDEARLYLAIYFSGTVFVTIYNSGNGILQALGNSKDPLKFLIATSVLNIFLDILFVRGFGMGVAGAAVATIISQAAATFMILRLMMKTDAEYKLELSKLRIDKDILMRIIKIGIPSGLQGMIVGFSNLIVMGYINQYGSSAIAGFSGANKIDNFLGLPVNSIALAATTFCGQNLGARQYDRVKKGIRASLLLSCAIVIVLGIIVYINAERAISLFSADADVQYQGSVLLRIMCPFYTALCFHQVFSSALRASGRTSMPMISSVVSFVVIRQIFLALTAPAANFRNIGWAYSGTWVIAAVITGICYFGSHWLEEEIKHGALQK